MVCMKRNAIIILLFALLILAACGRKFEQPLDGQWYRTSYKGQTYFLKTDGNSVLVYSDCTANSIRMQVRGHTISADSTKVICPGRSQAVSF